MKDKTLIFLTGITGSGKSSASKTIEEVGTDLGFRTHFIDDYPILEQIAKENRGNTELVTWQDTADGSSEFFTITPPAYQEISTLIASTIAHTIPQLIQDFDVIVLEAARGAGPEGKRDQYCEHLFEPFLFRLANLVSFANIEMRVNDHDDLLERVRLRSLEDPTAAPPFVVEKYISPIDGIQSATEQAKKYGELFKLNVCLDNSGNRETTQGHLEGIVTNLLTSPGKER